MELKPVKLTNQKAAVVRFWAAAQLLSPDTVEPAADVPSSAKSSFPALYEN